MRFRLSLTLDITRPTQPSDYREVDIAGTQTERLPEYWDNEASAGFRANPTSIDSPRGDAR